MKKFKSFLGCLIIILLLCGCGEKEVKEKKIDNKQDEKVVEPTDSNRYQDNNPIILGLYLNNNNSRELVTTLTRNITIYQDIVSLEVFYSNDLVLAGNQKTLWNEYYSKYQDIDKYKVGFTIEFMVGEEKITKTVLNPLDTESIFNYIQIYLYDDINQTSSWYSHVTKDEVTDETIFTSIKLTASTDIDKITSDITLTVFTYDEDDFDNNNNYKGNSKYTITIKKG